MESNICRWGILGTAGIARKNWQGIQLAKNATLVAVASREVSRAERFINGCQERVPFESKPEAVGGYDALLARDDIDAVYMPLPTGMRKEWVIRAAEAKKHVLAEKPAAISNADLQVMLDACQDNGVAYMDGVMFMHSRRLPEIRARHLDATASRSLGDLRRLSSHHAFAGDDAFFEENIRLDSRLEPHGALGDLGWYSIRFVLWAHQFELPTAVRGDILQARARSGSPEEVPVEFQGEMKYSNSTASFYCSFITENQQWVNLGGSKGYVHVSDFVLPFVGDQLTYDFRSAAYQVEGCQFDMHPNHTVIAIDEPANNAIGAQEVTMFETFSENTRDPWGTSATYHARAAMATQQVMDACFRSAQEGGDWRPL